MNGAGVYVRCVESIRLCGYAGEVRTMDLEGDARGPAGAGRLESVRVQIRLNT